MGNDQSHSKYSYADQLKKYAYDFAKIYRSEKQKRKELETVNLQLVKYGHDLNRSLSELKTANLEIEKAYLDTIHRLVIAAEYRDEDTGDHIARIGRYSALIAEKLGKQPDVKAKDMLYAAPMHDIGKIGIPDHILLKPGKPTDEEFDIIKTHTTIGANILSNSGAKIIILAEQIALSHHEKWNGQGYPNGLSGFDIPTAGRIVAVADVFDALTSKRPYKKAFPMEVALDIMKKERG
ncbi:MAG: HD domain-containing protein, partial [Desulfobacterales bacterium]|nr:HD domain-containing protein [Desulfobacterales bacterium]